MPCLYKPVAANSKDIDWIDITHASDFYNTVFDRGNSYSPSTAESVQ